MTAAEPSRDPALPELLRYAELSVEGRLPTASNLTLRCTIEGTQLRCVYKPTAGERPLWDFPDGSLGRREVATYEIAYALDWDVIPLTVWRAEGPFGPGMCQVWLEEASADALVDVVSSDSIPADWYRVFDGVDNRGREVSLVHANRLDLQRIALLDAVVNNADRKGGHLLVDALGAARGIDHGVTFAEEGKLRTVLWGWAGEEIPQGYLADLAELLERLPTLPLIGLTDAEIVATADRITALLDTAVFPVPNDEWPAIPWPIF